VLGVKKETAYQTSADIFAYNLSMKGAVCSSSRNKKRL
jgi:hypothetical protein